ncbi:MAG: DUF421 domain-containing protein [Clostridiales bacterium]|nr:DUF421 domain-containing protein [Clostridiales bacterium]
MDYVQILLTTLLSVVTLFALAKLMGNKQMNQLSMFDYIVGITIGSIAADLAFDPENPQFKFMSLVIFGLLAFLISVVTNKSLKLRRIITGRPILLFDNETLYRKNFTRARMDINDFLSLARVNGYYSLQDISTAILEINGQVSFLPKSGKRPVNPEDLGLSPTQEHTQINLVQDGILMEENLKQTGRSLSWLREKLAEKNVHSLKTVFLACLDADDTFTVYEK